MKDLKILAKLDNLALNYKLVSNNSHAVIACPDCGKDKLFINLNTGMWDCKYCGTNGGFKKLYQEITGEMADTTTLKQQPTYQEPIPDVLSFHNQLLSNPNFKPALEYLHSRGYTDDVIKDMRLGAYAEPGVGIWITIPYYNSDGNVFFLKKRAVPGKNTSEVRFKGLAGRDTGLYNERSLVGTSKHMEGPLEYLYILEGEMDTLALLSAGESFVVGVPGASTKKTTWVKKLTDACKKFILIYDNDKAGQTNARQMAAKLGLEQCYNVVLPTDLHGNPVKDVNDYLLAGGTLQTLQQLPQNKFAISDVVDIDDVLSELEEQLEKGIQFGQFKTGYKTVDALTGGFEKGDLVGVLADGKVGKTTWCQNVANNFNIGGTNCLFYCLEMSPVRLVEKHVCMLTETDKVDLKKSHVTKAREIASNIEGTTYFGYSTKASVDDIFENIRQAVHRYGIEVVVFDNLQLLSRSMEHSVNELSILSAKFKALAMELGIVLFLIIQPHRLGDGQIVSARNAMGSSAIEKNVDHMICLHRNRSAIQKANDFVGSVETDYIFDPYLLVKVDLARYGPGGQTTLYFDGSKSKVYDLDKIPGQQTEEKPPFELESV